VHPVLAQLELGGTILTLHAYGTFLGLAACAAGYFFVRGAGSVGLARGHAAALFVAAVLAGLVGARLLDAALNLASYAADPARLVSFEFRGFALFGGLAAAMAVALGWSRRAAIPLRRLADATIPAVMAGIVLLRIGCFLNGCCEGVATDLPWGVVFPPRAVGLDRDLLEGQIPLFGRVTEPQAVHPTQLYELAAAVLLALAARLAARSGAAPGVPALIFASGFLVFRAFNQAIRTTSADAVFPTLTLVAIYLCAGLAALALLARAPRARPRAAPHTSPM
jgi:phosphatidylglycerol:prolipoprotein diacylglycerol transferase